MKSWFWRLAAVTLLASGCDGTTDNTQGGGGPSGDTSEAPDTTEEQGETVEVSADISSNTTWKGNNTYVLKTHVFVAGATLTIEPGATILGEAGSSLVITQTGVIRAEGTREKPIVFTSAGDEGTRSPGDWGGVVLLGKAPINVTGGTDKIEGFPGTEARTTYGGTDADHDCGTLRFVQVHFAGFELAPDNELNSLTLGGCGKKTTVDYVQTTRGADDGLEVFGGTVDLKHIVLGPTDDDSLDWDFGWNGRVQFLVAKQSGALGDNGIEADNNKNNNDATPQSAPQIWNATFVGSNADPGTAVKTQSGALFRRGTAGELQNVIFAHYADIALSVADPATEQAATDGKLFVKNSIFFDNGNEASKLVAKGSDTFDAVAHFTGASASNRLVDPKLTGTSGETPTFAPASGSPALSGGATPPDDGFFDKTATHVGAVGADDWTTGWTAWPKD